MQWKRTSLIRYRYSSSTREQFVQGLFLSAHARPANGGISIDIANTIESCKSCIYQTKDLGNISLGGSPTQDFLSIWCLAPRECPVAKKTARLTSTDAERSLLYFVFVDPTKHVASYAPAVTQNDKSGPFGYDGWAYSGKEVELRRNTWIRWIRKNSTRLRKMRDRRVQFGYACLCTDHC